MRKKIGRIAFAILLVFLMVITIVLINKKNNVSTNNNGKITVIVNNINNEIIDIKRIEFNSGDTLFELVSSNFDVTYEDTLYGHYLTGINGIKTNGHDTFIWLELAYLKDGHEFNSIINFDDYEQIEVETGIDGIELVDNMIYGINEGNSYTKGTIFNRTIDIDSINNSNYTSNKTNPIKIVGIVLLCIVIISFIVLYIINMKLDKRNITIKELCILSLMTVLLFVQEEVLTFIPNIQLTFLLIALYTCVFGIKYTTFIIIIHVLLDNMIMGSMTPIVIIPMLLGYLITSLLVYLVRNKNVYIKTTIVVIGSIIYCYLFLVANSLFLDINIYAYWISDIPFEILLVLSNIFTMVYLYKPLEKIIVKYWNNY